MDKIFEYTFNNKKYVAYKSGEDIRFGFIDSNNSFNTSLNDEELAMIINIYNFLVGNKDEVVELSPIDIDNKSIRVLFNTRNRLYSFYDGEEPLTGDLFIKLNYLFNNQSFVLYHNGKIEDKNSKFLKVVVRVNKALVVVALSSSVLLSTLQIVPNHYYTFNRDYKLDSYHMDADEKEDNSDYSYSDVVSVIEGNPYLSSEEKEFFIKGLEDEINENIDYIDMETLKRNLSELYINYHSPESEYNEETGEYEEVLYPMEGSYSFMGDYRNQIDLFGNEKYETSEFSNCDKSSLVHEGNHALTKRPALLTMDGAKGTVVDNIYSCIDNPGRDMEELINELFSREYLEDFTNEDLTEGYDWMMPVMYGLCEIVDEDVLRKFKFDSDCFYLTNYFESIGVENRYCFDLFKCVHMENYYLADAYYDPTNLYNNNQKIYNTIKYCYEKKNNRPMESDLVMMAYFYDTIYVDDSYDEMFRNVLGVSNIERIVPKGYVSKKYKDKHPGVTIVADGKEIVINDSNRYINNDFENVINEFNIESNVIRH